MSNGAANPIDGDDVSGEEEDPSAHPAGLEVVRIDGEHWVVHDHAYSSADAEHLVACLEETDNEIDVVWVIGNIPLPTRYRDVVDVLDDLRRWRRGLRPATRPVEIAHFPPVQAGI